MSIEGDVMPLCRGKNPNTERTQAAMDEDSDRSDAEDLPFASLVLVARPLDRRPRNACAVAWSLTAIGRETLGRSVVVGIYASEETARNGGRNLLGACLSASNVRGVPPRAVRAPPWPACAVCVVLPASNRSI